MSPGTRGGTGHPLHLRCRECAASRSRRDGGYRLEATGRTKPLRSHHVGIRSTNRLIEIRCLECGHVGWTKHHAAEALLARFSA